jgi:hypothetical protein
MLPVWHGIDQSYLATVHPPLADLLAVSTSNGVEKVADEVSRAIARRRQRPDATTSLTPVAPPADAIIPRQERGKRASSEPRFLGWAWLRNNRTPITVAAIGGALAVIGATALLALPGLFEGGHQTTGGSSVPRASPTALGPRLHDRKRYVADVLSDRPVVYYTFDGPGVGALADGLSTHLPLASARLPRVTGSLGGDKAVHFENNRPFLAISPLAALTGAHPRTVELFFRTTRPTDQTLVDVGAPMTDHKFRIALTDGRQAFAPDAGPGLYIQFWDNDLYVPIGGLSDGRWHYLGLSIAPTSVTTVVDGATEPGGYLWDGKRYTQTRSLQIGVPDTTATSVLIGSARADAVDWSGGFTGDIDEFAIYARALPSASLARHFAS